MAYTILQIEETNQSSPKNRQVTDCNIDNYAAYDASTYYNTILKNRLQLSFNQSARNSKI